MCIRDRLCTLALAFLLSLMALPVHAAGNKGYVVTFRPGEYGRFSQSYLQKIEATGYSYPVSYTRLASTPAFKAHPNGSGASFSTTNPPPWAAPAAPR